MARTAWRMMFHAKLKMAGTLFGVVFAVILSNQQAGTFMGLLQKSVMILDNAGADIWVAPAGAQQIAPGGVLSMSAWSRASVTPGVDWAAPLLYAGSSVKRPDGASEAVTLVGIPWPTRTALPWNFVSGDPAALAQPDTMVFEDSQRDRFGGMNLGSIREVSGRNIRAGAFTWGLVPFGASFAFAEEDLARQLTHTASDQTSYVLVGVAPGQDPSAVAAELRQRIPEAAVFTKSEFRASTIKFVLTRTAIGVTFGTATLFGLIVGFVIVALTMLSSVIDNLRELGTLKAIGSTTGDLAVLLLVQSVTYAAMGSVLGLAVVTLLANGIRSAQLAMNLSAPLFGATVLLMLLLCVAASSLSVLRIRKLEPGMVFR